MASYDYSPLDRSRKSIRLVHFDSPPPGCDTICCSLDDYDLDTCPPFAALSYTWGEPDNGTDIYLDWTPFPVRENLHAALSAIRHFEDQDQTWVKTSTALTDFASHNTDLPQLMATLKAYTAEERWRAVVSKILKTPSVMIRNRRQPLHTDAQRAEAHWEIFQTMTGLAEDELGAVEWQHRYYWIDAICINQEDDSERGHQVDFMGDIYRQAHSVFAWLGPATAASDRMMRAIAGEIRPFDESGLGLEVGLKDMAERSYWQRLWTAQELILPQDVFLVCGHQKAPLHNLGHMFVGMGREKIDSYGALPMFQRLDARTLWRDTNSYGAEVTIAELFSAFLFAHCSDPRDRVYGVLSLLRNDSQDTPRLEADYTITARQLYYRLLGHLHRTQLTWTSVTEWLRHGLRDALGVLDDQSFRRNEFLYQLLEMGRQNDLIWPDDPVMKPYHGLLRDLHFRGRPRTQAYGSREPQEIYHDVVEIFSDFPRLEDPMTWEAFEQLLKLVLGLQLQEHDGNGKADGSSPEKGAVATSGTPESGAPEGSLPCGNSAS